MNTLQITEDDLNALLVISEPAPATRHEAIRALTELRHFMGPAQQQAVIQAMRGEEAQWFYDKMVQLSNIVTTMPVTYEQDGLGLKATAYLHYFAGGSANWWITEKDKGDPEDPPKDRGKQFQAFGLADLFNDGGELGYISIPEILEAGGELDFHFTPTRLEQIKRRSDNR